MVFGACVFIMNGDGLILGVTRKDDQDDFGLPGGKVEPGETPLEAAIRELEEETGIRVKSGTKARLLYQSEENGRLAITYQLQLTDLLGNIPVPGKAMLSKEKGTAFGWVKAENLANGTFGDYNKGLFKTLGIKLKSMF